MKYTQIGAAYVMNTIAQGYNIVICDFKNSSLKYTNELTVETVRSYTAQPEVAFFKIEEA